MSHVEITNKKSEEKGKTYSYPQALKLSFVIIIPRSSHVQGYNRSADSIPVVLSMMASTPLN